MTYLRVVDPLQSCEKWSPEDLACSFPFPLDPFQKHAIHAIHTEENVLVTAKTGSGKTLVGEYLIHHCLAKGKRVFYTTPIKSLSNQKFHDLKKMFPSVGIMTGDIKYKPDAQVLVMTTEILRNLLYKQGTATAQLGLTASISIEGLGGVVFDECHYINDPERGKVWEETLILLPPHIQLVLLSATIDTPELFASWVGSLKQKTVHLISTSYRIVPLEHSVFIGGNPTIIMDNKEIFYQQPYRDYLQACSKALESKDKHKEAVGNRKAGGFEDPVSKRKHAIVSYSQQMNTCLQYLREKDLLPALFFVFSRVTCERLAKQVQGSLISSSDSAAIQHIWDFHLHPYKDVLEHLPQAHSVLDLVKKGVAYHHSGLLPILREMVELLFGKGLIRCLFATETFAVGINMPTKTVVFAELEKYSDECNGHRLLRTDEYTQMAGRAGRRGKDTKGHVFYLPRGAPVDCWEMNGILMGKKAAVSSKMDFGYDFLLKTLQSKHLKWRDTMGSSYWNEERKRYIANLEKERAATEEAMPQVKEEQMNACLKREALEAKVLSTVNAAKKRAMRELQHLKEEQEGASWDHVRRVWSDYRQMLCKTESLHIQIANLEAEPNTLVEPRMRLLKEWGFMDETDTLTKKGVLASEVNEGHPILFAHAFENDIARNLEKSEFIAFLAAFLGLGNQKDRKEMPRGNLLSALSDIEIYAKKRFAEELILSSANPEYWRIDMSFCEPARRWYEGEDAALICQEHDIFEGNFMRSLLKLANMLEEWTNMAILTKDTDWLAFLEGMREQIVRGIARPESLYLTL